MDSLINPWCDDCGRAPDDIPGRLTAEVLQQYGWTPNVKGEGGWLCPDCSPEPGRPLLDDPFA